MLLIYNYIPVNNHVKAVLWLQYVGHLMLFLMINVLHFYISTFRSEYTAPNMAVFCRSLISCFLLMLFSESF